jgi:hypothetical protein
MVAFGTAGSLIPRVWKQRMMVVLAVGVMLFGLVFINRGLVATGSPFTAMTVQTAVLGTGVAEAQYQTAPDGVVEVPIIIQNTKFEPQVVQIPADVPVRLVVDRREDVACSDQIYLPQLNILKDLAPNGTTVVDIPATAAGSYTLTCGMSMMQGQLVVGDAGSGGPLSSPALWVVLASAGAVGALVVARKRDARLAAAAAHKKGATTPTLLGGFTATEIAIIVIAVASAVMAGLALGGLLR